MSEDFLAALEGKTLLKELLKNEDWEKQFRSSLKVKEENVIKYLVQPEVLSDMVQALINEEDRTLQEASEVLGIILSNVGAINDALATSHLPALFQYLHRNTMNPRRLYFFLRVASFIFQNKSVESLKFAIASPDFTAKVVKHLSSSHIMQLMIHILNLEKQMKEQMIEGCDWSTQTNLVGNIVIALEKDPSTTLEAVYKFLNEISNSYTPHSQFIKNILTQGDCSLPRCIIKLSKDKSVSSDAIKLLDEMVLKIIMCNEDDEEFFETIKTQLSVECAGFHEMLESEDNLGGVIIGVKVIHALIKHRVNFLIDPSIFNCIDLCFRFPWANILHNVIVNVIVYVFQSEEDTLIKSFLEAGLLKKIVTGLATQDGVGYRPHLRIIISSMHASPSAFAQDFFVKDPLWARFWEIMEYRDRPEWAFNFAETKVREELGELLYGAIPKSLPLSGDLPSEIPTQSTTDTSSTTEATQPAETNPENPTTETSSSTTDTTAEGSEAVVVAEPTETKTEEVPEAAQPVAVETVATDENAEKVAEVTPEGTEASNETKTETTETTEPKSEVESTEAKTEPVAEATTEATTEPTTTTNETTTEVSTETTETTV
jgi:hypothetical protein